MAKKQVRALSERGFIRAGISIPTLRTEMNLTAEQLKVLEADPRVELREPEAKDKGNGDGKPDGGKPEPKGKGGKPDTKGNGDGKPDGGKPQT